MTKGRIALEATYTPSLQAFPIGTTIDGGTEYVTDRAAVWNVRMGGSIEVRENLEIGAGLFTDRSPVDEIVTFPEFDVDYYGISAGVRSVQPVRLAEGESSDTLVFEWTLAVRYSYGTGDAGEARFDLVGNEFVSADTVDVDFHQLYLHVGTGLRF
jgi:hypothetical protein